MSDLVPKSGGGFFKGFLTGSAVSIAAICTAWVVFPDGGTQGGAVASIDPPDTSATVDVTLPNGAKDEVGAGTITLGSPEISANLAATKPSELEPNAGEGSETVAKINDTSSDRPDIPSAPVLPRAEAENPQTNGPESQQNTVIASATPAEPEIKRPPLPAAGNDPFAIPKMPQDQSVPAFPSTSVQRQSPALGAGADELDASLPTVDEKTAAVANPAPSAPAVDAGQQDANTFDTASARVGTSATVPERAMPSANEAVTLAPVTAPTPPRLPRVTLSAPQSIVPEPAPLTLPGVNTSPAPAPSSASASGGSGETDEDGDTSRGDASGLQVVSDAPEGGGFDAERSERVSGETSNARLDNIVRTPNPVGSLISRRDAEPETPPVDPGLLEASGRAFVDFAAPYDGDPATPRLAIILEDVGAEGISRSELVELGTLVTFAINPDTQDATEAQGAYREGGFEILAVVPGDGDMHIGAATQLGRLEPTAAAIFDKVPNAIGIVDRPSGNIFRSSRVVSALADTLAVSGHGLLVHEQFGVNRTIEALEERSIPAASVLRVIDDQRNPDAIRRNLDRAALDAGKTGGVVVYGRTYPETITALSIWSLSRAARGVSFAPVTATISGQ